MGIYIEKLDKPKNCSGCPCRGTRRITQDLFCRITRQSIDEFYVIEKAPDWCPMREATVGEVIAGTCDRKKECNTSPICGTECTLTFDKEHAVL